MGYLTLKKNFFNDFIAQLSKISKVVAPVSKGFNRYEFTEVHSGKGALVFSGGVVSEIRQPGAARRGHARHSQGGLRKQSRD